MGGIATDGQALCDAAHAGASGDDLSVTPPYGVPCSMQAATPVRLPSPKVQQAAEIASMMSQAHGAMAKVRGMLEGRKRFAAARQQIFDQHPEVAAATAQAVPNVAPIAPAPRRGPAEASMLPLAPVVLIQPYAQLAASEDMPQHFPSLAFAVR